ncbi:hypothetical protein D3C81_1855210 [compost metagenome]
MEVTRGREILTNPFGANDFMFIIIDQASIRLIRHDCLGNSCHNELIRQNNNHECDSCSY